MLRMTIVPLILGALHVNEASRGMSSFAALKDRLHSKFKIQHSKLVKAPLQGAFTIKCRPVDFGNRI